AAAAGALSARFGGPRRLRRRLRTRGHHVAQKRTAAQRRSRGPAGPGETRMTPSPTVDGPVHFRRRGRGAPKELHTGRAPATAAGRVTRLARLMALALRCEELLRSGQVKNLAALAQLGHVSRARISQIMSLVQLAPDLQEELLFCSRPARGRDPWHL